MRCSRPKELRRLYPRIVAEVARVLRVQEEPSLGQAEETIHSFEEWQQHTGGRAVLMTMLRSILLRALDAQKEKLRVVSEVQVRVFWRDAHLCFILFFCLSPSLWCALVCEFITLLGGGCCLVPRGEGQLRRIHRHDRVHSCSDDGRRQIMMMMLATTTTNDEPAAVLNNNNNSLVLSFVHYYFFVLQQFYWKKRNALVCLFFFCS